MNKTNADVNPGLEGVVAAATALSSVDGELGELVIAGYRVEDLAPRVRFEDAVHLLWVGRLPESEAERTSFQRRLGAHRRLSPAVAAIVRSAAEHGAAPMDALRTAVSALSFSAEGDDRASVVAGAFPAIIAAFARIRSGAEVIAPDPERPHAEDFLRMLSGVEPAPEAVRALDTYLNTTIDHGLNASTFTARAIISTDSDLVSAVTGAIGALKGPLHGGAPGPVLDMLLEAAATPDRAAYLRGKLARGERLMGFGHRIYRVRDPRANVLARACETLRGSKFIEDARETEETALRVLREHKPDRPLSTNVELYTALLLHAIGVPRDLFSPLFAMSRVAGWIAHAKEQLATKKLVRPQSIYVGPRVKVNG